MKRNEIISAALGVLFSGGIIFWALTNRQFLVEISAKAVAAGLIGVFLVSAIAASILSVTLVPIPYYLPVFFLSGALSEEWGLAGLLAVSAVSTAGATLGQMPTFAIGYSGSEISKRILQRFNESSYKKLLAWVKRRGPIAIALVSAVPNPVHLPITLALGMLRFSAIKWFFFSLIGNMAKNLVIASAGYYFYR